MIEFADMTQAHAAAVAAIEREAFSSPWSERQIAVLCSEPGATARVALEDGKVAGYYSFSAICGEGYVNNIAVAAGFRGRGIGSALMRDMISAARNQGLSALTLEVRKGNVRARAMYEKFGFEAEGIRKNFYENTEDAVIYWLHAGGGSDSQFQEKR